MTVVAQLHLSPAEGHPLDTRRNVLGAALLARKRPKAGEQNARVTRRFLSIVQETNRVGKVYSFYDNGKKSVRGGNKNGPGCWRLCVATGQKRERQTHPGPGHYGQKTGAAAQGRKRTSEETKRADVLAFATKLWL